MNRPSDQEPKAPQGESSSGIDWQSVKERLTLAEKAQSESEQLSVEQAREVMDRRAAKLSVVPERIPDTSEILEVVTFPVADEEFAVETRFVREVYRAGDITTLPGTPEFVLGLTNLRGEVLAIVDLCKLFGITRQAESAKQTVVLGAERPEFGVLVDDVFEVITLRLDDVLDPPGSVAGATRDYLRGVTESGLLVLNGETLLHDERLFVDETE